ncbi:hypothetical protein BJX68DRAFT_273410 [Aspergillus pseudodeflectus]|uniref:Uncharacterized protein n=1 Tax=Aspergillus pseudodeflectus TaxID=176178 RepID=A0ABR4J991_9EURO
MSNPIIFYTASIKTPYLPLARDPSFLGFFGAIEGLSLPNLTDFQKLQVHSDLPLDCGPLDDRFEPIVAETVEVERARPGAYSCNSIAANGETTTSNPVFAGIVAAAMVAGLALW